VKRWSKNIPRSMEVVKSCRKAQQPDEAHILRDVLMTHGAPNVLLHGKQLFCRRDLCDAACRPCYFEADTEAFSAYTPVNGMRPCLQQQ